jgi:hypothetical protein
MWLLVAAAVLGQTCDYTGCGDVGTDKAYRAYRSEYCTITPGSNTDAALAVWKVCAKTLAADLANSIDTFPTTAEIKALEDHIDSNTYTDYTVDLDTSFDGIDNPIATEWTKESTHWPSLDLFTKHLMRDFTCSCVPVPHFDKCDETIVSWAGDTIIAPVQTWMHEQPWYALSKASYKVETILSEDGVDDVMTIYATYVETQDSGCTAKCDYEKMSQDCCMYKYVDWLETYITDNYSPLTQHQTLSIDTGLGPMFISGLLSKIETVAAYNSPFYQEIFDCASPPCTEAQCRAANPALYAEPTEPTPAAKKSNAAVWIVVGVLAAGGAAAVGVVVHKRRATHASGAAMRDTLF